jgi:acyl carrier protein
MIPELRRHLQSGLPDYMVPSSFVLLDELPVTANGKVDRAALPEPEPARGAEEGTPPGTPEEKTMAGLWMEVLGVDEVRLEDNFFALGGHSLLATQLVSRIRTAFGIDLPLRRLFERSTLGELTASLDGGPGAAAPRAAEHRTEAPLLLAQERFWTFGRQGNVAYNLPAALRLRGRLDAGALEGALREIRRRHATLRTRFVERAGGPVQVIDSPGDWRLPGIDLSGLPESVREAEARRLAKEDSLRPFDLARGPIFRAALLELGPGERVLLLNNHHIVSDGWSMGVLMSELTQLYGACAAGRPSPLPELAVQYADLAAWQRERLSGGVLEARLDWWKKTLDGVPRLWPFPLDRPRPAVLTTRGDQTLRPLAPGLRERLQELGTSEGASLYMVMLAALALVIRGWTGQEDVIVGSPVAGREQQESERLIGAFLSLLPLRVSLSGSPSFRELLQRARRTALDAFAQQEVSFERILETLGLQRETAHYPLFQCVLNMLVFPSLGGELPGGIDVEPVLTGGAVSKYDFALYVRETEAGLLLDLTFATDLFDRPRMEALVDQLIEVLELAVAHPDAPIRQFPASAPDVVI